MINVQLTITGRVQGVGFRWGTLQIARQLGLCGFVRNQADGTVYVEAQGPKETVDRFICRLAQGPTSYAIIDRIQQTAGHLTDYRGQFTIRR
ncbi:acylphosphatase [Limosilactobacillus pontis]|uniref:Acylphosphatase n=1 Tax=Limosilactobacillus pontis TaxID=35787 RepID=A0ABT7UXW4_9LACO|nr:acylphosphatase [Limosilactobacillus pontis]MDM8266523.1 acylphosphatase [Limosilactobacillus pontis]